MGVAPRVFFSLQKAPDSCNQSPKGFCCRGLSLPIYGQGRDSGHKGKNNAPAAKQPAAVEKSAGHAWAA